MQDLLWKKPKNFQYLFLDMNAFFASCEQQAHPEFRNKPLAVTPTVCDNGCIITASYEARAYKIKTGFTVRQARTLYPNIIIRPSDTFLYLKYHQKFIRLISQITPFYQVKSIDKVVIRISPTDQTQKNSLAFGKYIKSQISQHLGEHITSSIGIAPNPFLAKLAAESKKPDGLTLLCLDELKHFYNICKLTDFCGINFRMQNRLNRYNIYTPMDFYNADIDILKKYFGKIGQQWYLKLHGYDTLDDFALSLPKTISQSHVLEPLCRNWPIVWSVCQKLFFKAAKRLREARLCAKTIVLLVKTLDHTYQKQYFKTEYVNDNFTLTRYFKKLWDKINKYDRPLKIIVVFTNLCNYSTPQQQLFSHPNKEQHLSHTIDKINNAYGKNKIISASMLKNIKHAPDRISFGQPKF